MNENYIPEDQNILESPSAPEEPIPEVQAEIPEAETMAAAEPAASETEPAPETEILPEEVTAEVVDTTLLPLDLPSVAEEATEVAPEISAQEAQVTDIIIETLAQ